MLNCNDCGRPAAEADLLDGDGYCLSCHIQIIEAMAELEEWMGAERDKEMREEDCQIMRALILAMRAERN